jgi:hypothetical protein
MYQGEYIYSSMKIYYIATNKIDCAWGEETASFLISVEEIYLRNGSFDYV